MCRSVRSRLWIALLVVCGLLAGACGGVGVEDGTAVEISSIADPAAPESGSGGDSDSSADDSTADSTGAANPADGGHSSVSGSGIEEARRAVIRVFQVGDVSTPEGDGVAAGTGSGFIIDASGLAVTNNHVAGGAAILEVTIDGETEPRNARVLGLSECADLAVIDIEGEGFPYLDFYQGPVVVGTEVLAAGYPLGTTEFTLTRGIISTAQYKGDTSWASVEAVIEHDARIRGGNSGGPLFTGDGYVIGVNYAGNEQHDFNTAIAAEYSEPIVELLSSGVPFEWIGLNAVAHAFGEVTGLWVNAVETGSPADKAGIHPGDFVVELEGVPLATDGTLSHYCDILRSQGIDDELGVELIRPETGEILAGNINSGDKIEVVFSPELGGQATVAGAGTAYTTFKRLVDDTGLISFQVPSEFGDVSTVPLAVDGYGNLAVIAAAEDLAAAFGSTAEAYAGNGAALIAFTDPNLDMVDTMVSIMQEDLVNCTAAGDLEPYETNGFEGVIGLLTNCANAQSTLIYVAARIPGESRFILLGIQAVDDAMLDAVPTILSSFRWEQ